jgi:isoleucyl-tRNA synthetase
VVGQKYGLLVDNPVGSNGVFLPNTELFAGEHVFNANPKVVEVLKQRGKLLHHEAIFHSYPHCWRHKTPIIFRATAQWFISMDQKNLRETALNEVKQVQWIPDWGQARIESMMDNRPDWCISRQRTWGVPITFFIHKETRALHPNTDELVEKVAVLIEKEGIEAWFALQAEELLGEEAKDYEKMSDTLDVWFDSGVTHEAVLRRRDYLHFPADLYLEGSDQHRGWFQSSLLASTAMNDVAPYKAVLTHGFTVDAHGKKMSKSLFNAVAPAKIMNELGADVLRLWVAATDYRGEMTVSDEIFKRISDGYRRLRNTARFLLSNLDGFNPAENLVAAENLLPLDRWVVDKAYQLQQEVIALYETYQFQPIYQKILHFCSIDLGGFYLDITKDRQYTAKTDGLARRSSQTAMYHVIEALTRWLAPITSYTADELWQFIPGERAESVFLATWYQGLFALDENATITRESWDKITEVRAAVSKELEQLRGKGEIGSSLNAEVALYADEVSFNELNKIASELHFIFITSKATLAPLSESPNDVIASELSGLKLKIVASTHEKCVRCWHQRPDVGTHAEHPELCGRCVENVAGNGEVRHYA